MTISILAQAVVNKNSGGDPAYTHAGFAVPGGTTRLLVQVEYRGYSSGAAPAISSVTHNGDAMSLLTGSATTGGFDDITTAWYHLASPDIGTFNVVVTFPSDVRGCKLWMLAISGEKESGSILGQSAFQRIAATATNTVGLGLTPAASGDSLLLASLAIAQATTLSSFTGAGFVEVDSDSYTGGGNLTGTSRYKLNASGSTTASATFGASDTDIGGSLIEILAEATGTDVSDTFGITVAVTGSVAAGSSASIADASYRRLLAWTEVLSIQPDVAGVDRRIIAAGPATAPNLTLDQSGTAYRASWRMTDGVVIVETAAGSQSVAAQHLAIVAGGTDGPGSYINGLPNGGVVSGGDLTGITDLGAGGQTVGSHATAAVGAYTGLVGRYLLYASAMSPEQIRMLALSETDPDALWGYGVEDDAEETNQSLVACPLDVALDGQPNATLTPTILDPAGGSISITSVTQPVNGTLAIAGSNRLVYVPTPGWQGLDTATYTASDGAKSSTGKIIIRQQQPSLKANGDSVTVAANGSVTFNPRINDVGAGPLFIVSATQGTLGSVTVNASGTITYQNTSAGSSDSFTYTVADNYGQATAVVSVTISVASFVSASADSINTLVGTAVDIDVIANDTASSDNLPLAVQPGSITTPSPSGTAALLANGRIRYTPASGFTGDVSFNYTAKPASKATPTSTAACSVRVLSVPAGTPKYPTEPTTAAKIRTVGYAGPPGSTQYSTIAAAIAAATPGDHIFLDNRDWGLADIDVTVSGTAGNPIVIRSRTHKGAILRGTCIGRGNHLWWHELTFAHPPVDPSSIVRASNTVYECPEIYSVVLFGHHQNVTRCNIRSSNGIWIHHTAHDIDALGLPAFQTHDNAIAYNSFVNNMTGVWGPHVNIYMGRFPSNSAGPYNIEIAYNLVSDLTANPNGGAAHGYWIYTGNSKPHDFHSGNEARNEIHHNLVDTAKTAAMYLKRGANVRYNYLRCTGANDQCVNLRHGGRSSQDGETVYSDVPTCYVEGNLFDDGGIKISDTDWVIRFNRFNTGYRDIQMMCGQGRNNEAEDGEAQSAKRTILVGNIGVNKYVLGFLQPNFHLLDREGGLVKGVRIYRAGQTITTANLTLSQVETGDAGYQLLDGQPAGTPSITPITKPALQAVCGCDIP